MNWPHVPKFYIHNFRVLDQQPGATHAPTLGFWMANASELLHFLKSDRHITAFSLQVVFMLVLM